VQIAAPEPDICEHSIVEVSKARQLPAMLMATTIRRTTCHAVAVVTIE
jgi:hypothetical protein